MQLDECELWLRLEPTAEHPDASDPLPADVEAGQACTLHTSAGAALVSIGTGKVTFSGSTPSFTLDAAVARWNGAPASGTLHVEFDGS